MTRPWVRVRDSEGAWRWVAGSTPAVRVPIEQVYDTVAVLDGASLWFRGGRTAPARLISLADVQDGQYAFVHARGKTWQLLYVG